MASMAFKAKTEAGFGLSGPSNLLGPVLEAPIGPVLEAPIGPFELVEALEKLVSY